MAQLFKQGETKVRPGVYYRYTTTSGDGTPSAIDGINAIVIQASWGPEGVTKHETAQSIVDTYGAGAGVEAAKMLKTGGASTVYVVRAKGTGGAKGTTKLGDIVSVTAKYEGARDIGVKVQAKAGDATKKQLIVLDGNTAVETFEFAAGATESKALADAAANSRFVDIQATSEGEVNATESKLSGGKNATITAQDYLTGFKALEPYRYNVLSTDSIDTDVAAILQSYAQQAEAEGKLIIGVIGASTETAFATRIANAKAINDKKIVYLGSGFVTMDGEKVEGAKAVNYAAGAISATPSSESITHSVVNGAVDVTERLLNSQYVEAIENGLLLLSVSPDGEVWFDSGINTLTAPVENEDNGWKKIKRTKVRFELFDRLDRATAPMVGSVNCNADGVAAIIQAGMGVINEMVAENKLMAGATLTEDPDNPYGGDSAWFVIQAVDVDSLEKIYLHYQFKYSQNA